MENRIDAILAENEKRLQSMFACFNPLSGEASVGKRVVVRLDNAEEGCHALWLPQEMAEMESVKAWAAAGKLRSEAERREYELLRIRHDFPYWAAKYAMIKRKGGGADGPLLLNRPQRMLVEKLEAQRRAGKPIRMVLLKARQWGGSTVIQLYMAWLQLVQSPGLNSLIIAHQSAATDEIMQMFRRLIESYPLELLVPEGEVLNPKEKKLTTRGSSRSAWQVPRRNCEIKVGTAERPAAPRGGDYNLVHLSEVGLWKATEGKKPEEVVRAACAGVLYRPLTMIVYESTANGVGNFFHREYMDARDNPSSPFSHLFVSWFDIEQNMVPFDSDEQKREFARRLIEGCNSLNAQNARQQSGFYLWSLWQKGATLEGINWYIMERGKHTDHGSMAAECPTDDIEAFVNSGAAVFDKYLVEKLRQHCMPPLAVGDIESEGRKLLCSREGRFRADSLGRLSFKPNPCGSLSIWEHPCADSKMARRYLAVVDIGGRHYKSDWSVVAVFDREPMLRGEGPKVVAQWYGHEDMDLLAWKATQIASYYCHALLVIESNTLETRDPLRSVEGDQSLFILNQIKEVYPELYARRQTPDEVRQGLPRRFGFHTNTRTKPLIISTLVSAVREGDYTERDERCLDEMLTYERKQNGAYGAIDGAHDDLLMTRAIALYISQSEMDAPEFESRRRTAASNPLWP